MDVAGRVEAVGAQVTRFRPGDEVFGWCDGSFAEYACASEDHFAAKPAALSFEEAAVVPISGFAALQAVRDVGEVRPGHKVMVIRAAGAVGWFAVQLAKAFGAQVTGVAGTTQVELVARSAPTRSSTTPAKTSPTGPGSGTSSSTPGAAGPCHGCDGPSRGHWSSSAAKGRAVDGRLPPTFGRRWCHGSWASGCGCWSRRSARRTCRSWGLIEAGKLRPHRQDLPAGEAPEAMRALEAGNTRGKIVITV